MPSINLLVKFRNITSASWRLLNHIKLDSLFVQEAGRANIRKHILQHFNVVCRFDSKDIIT